MSQAPQLERSEMSAAEHANQKLAEQIMVLMAKALRESAKRYPPKLRNALSDPTAEIKLEISFGGEKAYSAALGPNNQIKATYINSISDSQARFLQEALSKSKGESLNNSMVRDMRVLVNGKPLFQMKDGKVIQNDLPPDFTKAITDLVRPKPLEVSFTTGLSEPTLSRLDHGERNTPLASGAIQTEANGSKSFNRGSSSLDQSLKELGNPSQTNQFLAPINAEKVERSAKHLIQVYGDGSRYTKAATHTYSMNEKGDISIARQSDKAVVFHKGEVTKAATSDDTLKMKSLPSQLGQIMAAQRQNQTMQKQEMEVG